jgi:acyl dehydratase
MTAESRQASKAWSEQASYRQITPEMIKNERWRVGKELSWVQPHVEVATKDAIRHWANGIGDRNPLWTDESYAARTRWRDIIAPPSMVMCLDRNILGSSMRGFPGVHSWQLGNTFEWHAPILRDTPVAGTTIMEDMHEVESRYAGGIAVDQTIKLDLRHRESGELLCTARTFIRRFSRTEAARTQKYGKRERHVYTDDELTHIADMYRSERIRGAEPRYVEDVTVGDRLPSIVRGPLTVSDCLAFVIAWGGAYIFAHGNAWDFFSKHPGAFPPDQWNVPDTPERTHYVDEFAQRVGAPAAFDYGPQRVAWAQTMCTNWIGDAGDLLSHTTRLPRPNYHGDCVYIDGRVTAVDTDTGIVSIALTGRNQVEELVLGSEATVRLPRRTAAR